MRILRRIGALNCEFDSDLFQTLDQLAQAPISGKKVLSPLKTLQSRGILWSGGSDYFVTPVPARYGLWASMVRQTAKGTYGVQPFGTAETVDIHTALRSYTAWGSRQMFLEDKIGTLEIGKRADIAVWDRDLYSVRTEQIKDLKCLLTLLDGEVVYSSQDSPVTIKVR